MWLHWHLLSVHEPTKSISLRANHTHPVCTVQASSVVDCDVGVFTFWSLSMTTVKHQVSVGFLWAWSHTFGHAFVLIAIKRKKIQNRNKKYVYTVRTEIISFLKHDKRFTWPNYHKNHYSCCHEVGSVLCLVNPFMPKIKSLPQSMPHKYIFNNTLVHLYLSIQGSLKWVNHLSFGLSQVLLAQLSPP